MNLTYNETGSGPPLIILHGLFGAARNWSSIARRLGAGRRVISVDLRNHGNAPWAATMSYPEMAEDVAGLIEGLGLARPVVMGHSMGGKVAMVLALTRPDLVGALIVVDVAPVAYARGHDGPVAAMRSFDLSATDRRAEVDRGLADAIPDTAMRGFLLSNLVTGERGLRWRLNLEAIERELETISGFPDVETHWTGPALFLTGAESRYVRPQHHDRIRALFPAARFTVLKNAGHWVHADQPDAFVAAVTDFLD